MLKKSEKIIALVAGGTGGHIYPALEVALRLQNENKKIIWLGQPDSLESEIAKKNKIDFFALRLKKIKGQSFIKKIVNSLSILILIFRAYFLIRKIHISHTLVFGGYVSFPFAIACLFKKSKLFIHEQNSIAGLSNKVLSYFAAKIFVAFESSFKGKKVIYCGNPVRQSILKIEKNYHNFNPNESIRILIFGGSLGAKALNEAIPNYLSNLAKKYPIEIIHQYGTNKQAPKYQNCQKVETLSFIDDISKAYTRADMVICRAGAMSVSEIEAIGIFALFIPFPFAVNDHQYLNAMNSVNHLNRFVIRQNELNEDKFNLIFKQLIAIKNNEIQAKIQKETQIKKEFYTNTLNPIMRNLQQ